MAVLARSRLQRRGGQRPRSRRRLPRRLRLHERRRSFGDVRLRGRHRQRRRRGRRLACGQPIAPRPATRPSCPTAPTRIDNDGDGLIDHPADPGCATPDQSSRTPPVTTGSTTTSTWTTDFPADDGCVAAFDLSEVPDCDDGHRQRRRRRHRLPCGRRLRETWTTPPSRPSAATGSTTTATGGSTTPPPTRSARAADDPIEAPQCGDGVDNDGDRAHGLPGGSRAVRAPPRRVNRLRPSVPGDLLVVDRSAHRVFSVDPGTGVQRSSPSSRT